MQRLTIRNFNMCEGCPQGPACAHYCDLTAPVCQNKAIYDRLADYEDTNMEPGEIMFDPDEFKARPGVREVAKIILPLHEKLMEARTLICELASLLDGSEAKGDDLCGIDFEKQNKAICASCSHAIWPMYEDVTKSTPIGCDLAVSCHRYNRFCGGINSVTFEKL